MPGSVRVAFVLFVALTMANAVMALVGTDPTTRLALAIPQLGCLVIYGRWWWRHRRRPS